MLYSSINTPNDVMRMQLTNFSDTNKKIEVAADMTCNFSTKDVCLDPMLNKNWIGLLA